MPMILIKDDQLPNMCLLWPVDLSVDVRHFSPHAKVEIVGIGKSLNYSTCLLVSPMLQASLN